MHVGHDTCFYLAKGFSVVAIEANPELVSAAEEKFAREIAEGRLRIFGVAISERSGTAHLAVADRSSFSSLSPADVGRAEQRGVRFRDVEVPTVPFEDILNEVGIPYYLKVDIEGLDRLCVRALEQFQERPAYVSIESSVKSAEDRLGFDEVFKELAELHKLGYRKFQYVDQRRPQRLPDPPLEGQHFAQPVPGPASSGAFGAEAPGPWESFPRALVRGVYLRALHELLNPVGRWSKLPPVLLYRRMQQQGRRPREAGARRGRRAGRSPLHVDSPSRLRVSRLPTGPIDLHARLGSIE